MLPDRACFILGERAECNTRRCVSKNVTKKWSKCQSGIQLGCAVGSWEAIPKALQASRQAEWDVSTCDWDTHSQFGFWEQAYSRISVPGGHVRQRAGAHFGKRPEGADKTVLGNADQARRNLEGEGATKLCAGRLGTIVEKTSDDSTGLVQSNTDGGLQLEQVWPEYYQKVFHNAHWGRKAGDRGQEAGKNNVLVHTIPSTNFKFLDIFNYLGQSTSYERWVKMYESSQTKSWLQHEWLDCADKLHYDGLSLNRCWFSKLKNEFVLLLEEYEDCQQVFREQGMRTFDCWLEYYNNLDVSPFVEAQEKRRGFYSGLCVNIFEDAVSLLGVSLQYLLWRMLQDRNLSELYAPEKEAYEILKGAVVGGPSLVFTRKHEVGKTTTAPPHKSMTTRVHVKRLLVMTSTRCTRVLFWKKMPCRPGKVTHYENSAKAGWVQKQAIPKSVVWFCRGWHPCPQRVVDKIRRIPTIVLQQLYPIQSNCGAHERVFAMNQENWDTNWKALWKADREKDLALRPAIGMVPWAWSWDHGLNHWPTPKNINMVHKRGDRK